MKGRFFSAVHSLATSDAPIQERLAGAAESLAPLKPEELPEDLRHEFVALMRELTKHPATGNEGTIAATTSRLTVEQAHNLAEQILHIYTELLGGL